ncbi:hypothetical protein pzkkv8_212 [Klebsiella phage pzk-kv8]|nr:hypothetical protein pzkkv8_212 [Klebsiella phage pzk-kv8]
MEIVVWVLVAFIGYLVIGNIVACCMKLRGHIMTDTEHDFKIVIALWPAPVILGVLEALIKIVTFPFGGIYRFMDKRK